MFLSHSSLRVQHDFEKALFTQAVHGHYTPCAFLAEFVTAKLAGTNGQYWKWRQITVLALLATVLFLFARNSGYGFQLSRLRANLAAVSLTAILIFQPQMRDFIAWPFMILQLCWLLFTVIALLCLVQMARRPTERVWPWLAAGSAYGSLHFLGLGIATVVATAAVLAVIWSGTRRGAPTSTPHVATPLLGLIVPATLHMAFMIAFSRAETLLPSAGWQPRSFLLEVLGFVSNFALATLRNLFSTSQPSSTWQNAHDWPYGLAILLGCAVLASSSLFRFLKGPTTPNQVSFVLQTFASVSFVTIIALIAVREWHEPSPHGFADYLTGARYLVPSTFALAGIMAELLFLLAALPTLLSATLYVGLAVCAVLGGLQYATYVYPRVTSRSMISHEHAWRALVSMARECRRAGLPIPNVPLGALTQEFNDWDLELFQPLLRAELRVPPETGLQFMAWPDRESDLPNEYDRAVPTLVEVRKQLRLKRNK